MDIENDVQQDSSPVEEAVVETPAEPTPSKVVEKTVPYSRFKEVNDTLAKLKEESKSEDSIDALNLIKLGKKLQDYSEEEIEFGAQHAKSKRPEDILKAFDEEMVQLAIQAKREKVDKERTLTPSSTQPDADRPKLASDVLTDDSVSRTEKEELLKKMGLYKETSVQSYRKVLMP